MIDHDDRRSRPTTEAARCSYRILVLTPEGRVVMMQRLPVEDEGEARRLAGSMAMNYAVDLWDGLRFVEHFAVKDPAPADRGSRWERNH